MRCTSFGEFMPDGAVSIQLSDAEHTPAGSPLTLGRDQTLSGKQVDVWHGLDVRPIRRTESWLGSVLGELRDLLSLAAGWDSYGAAAIDADLAPLVNSVLGWLAREQQPRPSLVPT